MQGILYRDFLGRLPAAIFTAPFLSRFSVKRSIRHNLLLQNVCQDVSDASSSLYSATLSAAIPLPIARTHPASLRCVFRMASARRGGRTATTTAVSGKKASVTARACALTAAEAPTTVHGHMTSAVGTASAHTRRRLARWLTNHTIRAMCTRANGLRMRGMAGAGWCVRRRPTAAGRFTMANGRMVCRTARGCASMLMARSTRGRGGWGSARARARWRTWQRPR
eukprot:1467140-Pleurochrysis_carterae.AAC.3